MEPLFPRTSTPEQMPPCVQDTQISVTTAADNVFRVGAAGDDLPPGTVLSSRVLNDDDWYIKYEITVAYDIETGLKVMPAAGPKGSAGRPVRLHGGAATKYVGWSCERVGAQPILPHWETGDPNLVLIKRSPEGDNPEPLGDSRALVFRYRGVYVYEMIVPPADEDALPLATTVILNLPANQYALAVPLYDRGLLGAILNYAVQGVTY